MNDQTPAPYPGETATVEEILVLANQYALAFRTLVNPLHGVADWTRAPAGLCAIHAIELYLAVALRLGGLCSKQVRSFQHDLGTMTEHESIAALGLRKKTSDHLKTMKQRREYLVVRYAPDMKDARSELTRLAATLKELAEKVGHRFDAQNAPTPSGS